MLVKYKKQANISAGIWLVTLIAFLASPLPSGNIWESGDIPRMLLMTASVAAFWFCFWAYAKAKGYSGWLGVVLPIFSVIGLVILAMLKDKLSFPLFFVFQPIGIMPLSVAHVER